MFGKKNQRQIEKSGLNPLGES